MRKFQLGDTVSVLDDDLRGQVVEINNSIKVLLNDGFEMEFSPNELVLESSLSSFDDSLTPSSEIIENKESGSQKKKSTPRPKRGEQTEMVIDLHIEKLVKRTKNMSSYDILTKQLDTAKYHIEMALRKRIQKLVLIHGVGEGVLRADLESLIRRYDHLRYSDADFRKYGQGALEIYIPQSAFY